MTKLLIHKFLKKKRTRFTKTNLDLFSIYIKQKNIGHIFKLRNYFITIQFTYLSEEHA